MVRNYHAHTPRLVTIAHSNERIHGSHTVGKFNTALAIKISMAVGSMWALYAFVAWQLGWIVWQSSGIGLFIKDPYPFSFLLFLSNLIQLWLLPTIMVGQNVQTAHQDEQTKADHETITLLYEINKAQLSLLEALKEYNDGRK